MLPERAERPANHFARKGGGAGSILSGPYHPAQPQKDRRPPGSRPCRDPTRALFRNVVVYSMIAAASCNCSKIPVRTVPEPSHKETAWQSPSSSSWRARLRASDSVRKYSVRLTPSWPRASPADAKPSRKRLDKPCVSLPVRECAGSPRQSRNSSDWPMPRISVFELINSQLVFREMRVSGRAKKGKNCGDVVTFKKR